MNEEIEYSELWILMYQQDIGSFFGGFPSEIHQWFVMDNHLPKLFNSRQEAVQYQIDNSLIPCTPILWASFDSILKPNIKF